MPSYILTGAPGAGKTAVLRLLEASGYAVVEEAATGVIALGNALGSKEPWLDHDFVDKVITLQRQRQDAVAAVTQDATVFFDRSPTCSFEDSVIFEQLHEQAYRELGFNLVDVPAGPLANRTTLILQAIFQRQSG
jgi:predicted ATPase